MRPIDDILCDVIEALVGCHRPKDPPEHGSDPAGLPLWTVDWEGIASETEAMVWVPNTDVDTAELIDAALACGLEVNVFAGDGVEVIRKRGSGYAIDRPIGESATREAVILALAEALGVETEE